MNETTYANLSIEQDMTPNTDPGEDYAKLINKDHSLIFEESTTEVKDTRENYNDNFLEIAKVGEDLDRERTNILYRLLSGKLMPETETTKKRLHGGENCNDVVKNAEKKLKAEFSEDFFARHSSANNDPENNANFMNNDDVSCSSQNRSQVGETTTLTGADSETNCTEYAAFVRSEKGCFACWICLKAFASCLAVKKHILEGHAKALCALALLRTKDGSAQAVLLLFCPKDCQYVTSKVDSFLQHIAVCQQAKLASSLQNFEEIQNNFISDEYSQLMAGVVSGSLLGILNQHLSTMSEEGTNGSSLDCDGDDGYADDDGSDLTNQSRQWSVKHRQTSEQDRLTIDLADPLPGILQEQTCRKDADFSGSEDIHMQMRTNEGVELLQCAMCRKTFNDSSSLHTHLRSHAGEKRFECDECGKFFSESGQILRHMKIHSGERPFECGECGKSFYEIGHLSRHMKIHSGERPFECEECGKSFVQSNDLYRHLRTHTGEKPFQCDECGKSFRQSGHLQVHMRTHTEDKPLKCQGCDKSFSRDSDLYFHMRMHADEKPYKCDECGKGFNWSKDLRFHMKSHSREKPFVCCECDKRFHNSRYLQIHMRTHTGEKPFICNACGKSFTQNSNLHRHMRTHTGEKPFKCDECDRSFNQSSHLHTHKLKTHRGDSF